MATRNPELEAAILEAPDSPDAYLVYGDWLLEQGDPLGELVSVQAMLAKLRKRAGKPKEKSALEKREKALLKDAEARLGDLREHEHTWSFGFLEGITIPNPSAADYEAFLAAPAARFLRELDIEEMPPNLRGGVHPTIALLARLGVSPALRKLSLLERHDYGRPIRPSSVPPAFWTRLASLRELTIRVGLFDPGTIELPRLEVLRLTTPLTDELIQTLRSAECPLLSSVELEAEEGELEDATAVTAARLEPLFVTWTKVGTLRHLGVTEHGAGDQLVDVLLETGLTPQLTSLDLSRSRMSDAGAKAILENATSFEHLESLNLCENDLSGATCRALEKTFDVAVDVEEQGTRYDAIEE